MMIYANRLKELLLQNTSIVTSAYFNQSFLGW